MVGRHARGQAILTTATLIAFFSTASAADVEQRVQELVAKGKPDSAAEICERILKSRTLSTTERSACASAYLVMAGDDLALLEGVAQRWTQTDAGDKARERWAELRLVTADDAAAMAVWAQTSATKAGRADAEARWAEAVAANDTTRLRALASSLAGLRDAASAEQAFLDSENRWAAAALLPADDLTAARLWARTSTTKVGRADAEARWDAAVAAHDVSRLRALASSMAGLRETAVAEQAFLDAEFAAALVGGPDAVVGFYRSHPGHADAREAAFEAVATDLVFELGFAGAAPSPVELVDAIAKLGPPIASGVPGAVLVRASSTFGDVTWTSLWIRGDVPFDTATRDVELRNLGLLGVVDDVLNPRAPDTSRVCALDNERLVARVVAEGFVFFAQLGAVPTCAAITVAEPLLPALPIGGKSVRLGMSMRELRAVGLRLLADPQDPDLLAYGPESMGGGPSIEFRFRSDRLIAVSASTWGFDDAYDQKSPYNLLKRAVAAALAEAWKRTSSDGEHLTCYARGAVVAADTQSVGAESGDPSFDILVVAPTVGWPNGSPPRSFRQGPCGANPNPGAPTR